MYIVLACLIFGVFVYLTLGALSLYNERQINRGRNLSSFGGLSPA